jgi:hypothetical protein
MGKSMMKMSGGVLFPAVLLLVATASLRLLADDDDSDRIKIVTSGEVRKIDLKKKTFEFKIDLDQPVGFVRPANRNPGPVGRGGRRGPYGRGPYGRGPVRVPAPETSIEVKVYVSERTLLKQGAGTLNFSDLKNGERVSVTGIHRGRSDDIDAIQIATLQETR